MKAEADIHFLQGVTQLIGHGWPYSHPSEEYPGARFYAAAVFNDRNPWWIAMPDIARYLQRMSFLLRQGRPANDVALYLPTADAWSNFRPGQVHMIEALRERVGPVVMPQILESGYGLDFIDDGTLERVGRVEKDTLVMGQGRHRVVVLPGVEYMPLATLRKLEEFARGGGRIVATRHAPSAAPGRQAGDAERSEFRATAARLFTRGPATVKVVEKDEELGAALRELLTPDMALSPAVGEIGFVHRSTEAAEIYFVVNTSNQRQSVAAAFRISGREAERWDPMSGRAWRQAVASRGAETTEVKLELAPYESRVLVFPAQGRKLEAHENIAAGEPLDISRAWKVTYAGGPPAGTMEELRSWTEAEETRYYSGQATYEKTVEIPASLVAGRRRLLLDFGEGTPLQAPPRGRGPGMRAWLEAPVREAAVVYVNEQRAGSVWSAPFAVEVSTQVRAGRNDFRIVVGNTAINHMAGRALPDYRLLNLRYGVRFEPQDMNRVAPAPSGLIGRIRLVPVGTGSANLRSAPPSTEARRGSVEQGSLKQQ
jgi:hypothetical protein